MSTDFILTSNKLFTQLNIKVHSLLCKKQHLNFFCKLHVIQFASKHVLCCDISRQLTPAGGSALWPPQGQSTHYWCREVHINPCGYCLAVDVPIGHSWMGS